MDWAAFDFLQVHFVTREGLQGGEQRSRAMREPHGERHFMGVGGG